VRLHLGNVDRMAQIAGKKALGSLVVLQCALCEERGTDQEQNKPDWKRYVNRRARVIGFS
jgi:hypothetical protein